MQTQLVSLRAQNFIRIIMEPATVNLWKNLEKSSLIHRFPMKTSMRKQEILVMCMKNVVKKHAHHQKSVQKNANSFLKVWENHKRLSKNRKNVTWNRIQQLFFPQVKICFTSFVRFKLLYIEFPHFPFLTLMVP